MLAIREVLNAKGRDVKTVQGSDTVMDVIRQFTDCKVRCLVVTDGDALIGLVTVRDVLTYIGEHGAEALQAKVSAVMTRDVTSITPDTRLEDAGRLFAKNGFNHLPVVEDGALVGLVTPADVLRRYADHLQEEAGFLHDYISGVYS